MNRRGLRKGEGRTWGAALSPWRHGNEERERIARVEQGQNQGHNGRRGVTWWHDKHDASRLTSRLALRVGNPSHGYHPQGFYTGARSPEGGREGGREGGGEGRRSASTGPMYSGPRPRHSLAHRNTRKESSLSCTRSKTA